MAAAALLTLGTLLTMGNYAGIAHARRTRVGFSCIPILGGLFGCIGLFLLPRMRPFALIPLLVDPGCVMMLAFMLVGLVSLAWRKLSKKNWR
jgi:hypothetical protein